MWLRYVNGQEVGSSDQWATHTYHFEASCDGQSHAGGDIYGDNSNVYAIHGIDTGGPAAILATVTNCGSSRSTGLAWKCTADDPGADSGWNDKGYDDSAWPLAAVGGINGVSPWGVRPDIDMTAHWIWAKDLLATDEVWCRITTGEHPYDDGMYAVGDPQAGNDGQIHIGADDMATIYVNGDEIAQTTIDQCASLVFPFACPSLSPDLLPSSTQVGPDRTLWLPRLLHGAHNIRFQSA